MKRPEGVCKDCWARWLPTYNIWAVMREGTEPKQPKWRPAPYQGPRCATDHRAATRTRKERAHDRRVQTVFELEPGEYARLLEFQGGKCAICQRATGKTKRLAVDHDHGTARVRGLLCGPCNQLLGHGRDDPEFFRRIIGYLTIPPYTEMLWLNAGTNNN